MAKCYGLGGVCCEKMKAQKKIKMEKEENCFKNGVKCLIFASSWVTNSPPPNRIAQYIPLRGGKYNGTIRTTGQRDIY